MRSLLWALLSVASAAVLFTTIYIIRIENIHLIFVKGTLEQRLSLIAFLTIFIAGVGGGLILSAHELIGNPKK